ncbi:hypothetical protein, partial [uncultured Maricaulis sp.]|uniref:hypothetical protein n=1 Tax=uncultured Maricaulis sp. TaxID=174710 RepID=UPI0030D8BF61
HQPGSGQDPARFGAGQETVGHVAISRDAASLSIIWMDKSAGCDQPVAPMKRRGAIWDFIANASCPI